MLAPVASALGACTGTGKVADCSSKAGGGTRGSRMLAPWTL